MNRNLLFLTLAVVVSFAAPEMALAQDIFAAPTSFLQQIKGFITGTGGILLGGAAIALLGISAAAPRVPVSWGQFFVGVVVLSIFFGGFQIAESLQNLVTG